MTRNELQGLCNKAKELENIANSGKSDACIMVLELMDTDEYGNNYCSALEAVFTAFPEINRGELEKELDRYI